MPGTAVRRQDIEAWEAETGITISPGDTLFLRTGRDVGLQGGYHPSLIPFLKERDIALLGADVPPGGGTVEGVSIPIHFFTLVALGVHVFDNMGLEELAETARELNRWEFLFNGRMGCPTAPARRSISWRSSRATPVRGCGTGWLASPSREANAETIATAGCRSAGPNPIVVGAGRAVDLRVPSRRSRPSPVPRSIRSGPPATSKRRRHCANARGADSGAYLCAVRWSLRTGRRSRSRPTRRRPARTDRRCWASSTRRSTGEARVGRPTSGRWYRATMPRSPWQKPRCIRAAMHPPWTALLLGRICPIGSLVAPCQPGASPLSVLRGVSPRTSRPSRCAEGHAAGDRAIADLVAFAFSDPAGFPGSTSVRCVLTYGYL